MFLGIGSNKTMNFVLDFSVCYIKVVTFSIEEYFCFILFVYVGLCRLICEIKCFGIIYLLLDFVLFCFVLFLFFFSLFLWIIYFICLFAEHLHIQFYCFEITWSPLIVCCVGYLEFYFSTEILVCVGVLNTIFVG